jgi:uncharacterized membrane protein YbaN (DUF454 family)
MSRTVIRYVLLVAGSISLAIGVIGIFIPVLPTTPLLLITAYCYLRSSKRMYNWLIHHRILGIYIYNYLEHKAVPRKTKIGAIVFLWLTLIISILLIGNWYVRTILMVVGICVSIHLFTLKTLERKDPMHKQ